MTDYDSPWKEALERYFPEFVAFFFPLVHAAIDWQRGYTFLDKELQKVVRDAKLGRRLADKLVRVFGKDGREGWLLVHIEVQGQTDPAFGKRMYVYNYRLFDRYDRPVISLAVLCDTSPDWRPHRFGYERWGCEVSIRFPMVKLLDYRNDWSALEQSRNPFAVLVICHLKTQETADHEQDRYRWKLRLIKSLYERGYQRQDILELFRFIDWMMQLPAALEDRLWVELRVHEEAQKVTYITSVERIGIKKGIQQGVQQGLAAERRLLLRQIQRRFGAEVTGQCAPLLEQIADQHLLEEVGEVLLDNNGVGLLQFLRDKTGAT